MTFSQDHDRVNSVDSWLDSQHPISGNFDLPVETDGAPKPSGPANLTREGWDEEGISAYPSSSLLPRPTL